MRMPDAIEPAEPCRRRRFVDRRIGIHPRIAFRDRLGETGESVHKIIVQQSAIERSGTVMHQPYDRPDPQLARAVKPAVRPGPIVIAAASMTLPEDRKTQRAQAERRKAFEVIQPPIMAVARELIAHGLANPDMRTFHAAPHLEWGLGFGRRTVRHDIPPCGPDKEGYTRENSGLR